MDTTREHLWGQLLVERCLVAPPELAQLTQARDHYVQQGHDCSLAGLLMQQRRLDQNSYAQLHHEVEGRGRACFNCRRVFLAQHPAEPPACPGCGGPSALAPPGTGQQAAYSSGRFQQPGGSGRQQAPSGSGRQQAPPVSGQYQAQASTGAYPAASGQFQAPPGASGRFQAPPGQYTPQQHPSGHYARPGQIGSGRYTPGSGGYAPAGGSVRMQAPGGYNPQADQLQPSLASLRWNAPRSTPSEQGMGGQADVGVGKRFGKYEILDELGRGGMGVVYKVREFGRQECYALKVLLAGEFASPKLLQRFRDEAQLASKLRHPNIVAVQDVGEVDGIPYYAMDYVKGSELQDLIRQKNLSVRRGAEVLVEVARAAHHAHEHGIVHRDLKPSNVLIGEDGTPFIMDFGLAKNLEQDKGLTRSGVAIGTPYYMPPEQARGQHKEMDARSDVYAIGAILYEILTRRVPFTAKTQNDLLRKIIETEAQPPRQLRAGIPVALETICLKALNKEKKDRYISALAMADDLGRFLSGMPIQARPLPIWIRVWRKAKKNKQAAAAIALISLVVLIALGVVINLSLSHDEDVRARDQENTRKLEEQQQQQAEQQQQQQQQLAAQQAVEGQRKQADDAVNRAVESAAKARMATSLLSARESLRRSEAALSEAASLEEAFTEHKGPRAATAYRRGLVRRDLCHWEQALKDFETAAKVKGFKARANLQLGLIRMRVYSDKGGAQEAFSAAQASSPEDHEGEEKGAQDIARAYSAIHTRPDDAIRGLSRVLERGDVTLAAEGNGAWAYAETINGDIFGGEPGDLDRALRRARLAVEAEKFRFAFVVDLAMLLARKNQLREAKEQLLKARALDGNAPGPDLVQAVVAVMENQAAAMRSALTAARSKARDRGALAVDAVRMFESKLSQSSPSARPPPPGATPRASRAPVRPPRGNTITGTSSAAINFSPGTQTVTAVLQIKAETQAIKLKLTRVERGVRILARFGRQIQSVNEADYSIDSDDGDNLVLVLRRDSDEKPLRTGTYHLVFLHPKPTRDVACQLSTTYYKQGDRLPLVWKALEGGDIQLDRKDKGEADRLVAEFRSGKRDAAIEGWEQLEKSANTPALAVIRVQWLMIEERWEDALLALDVLLTAGEEHADFAAFSQARCEAKLNRIPQAVERLRKLLKKDSSYLNARTLLVDLYLEAKDYRNAFKVADAVRKLDPDSGLAVVQAGLAMLGADLDRGVARLEEAVQKGELSNTVITRALEGLFEAEQHEKLLELVEVAIAGSKANYPLQWELFKAQSMAKLGKPDEALARLETIRGKITSTTARIDLQRVIDLIKAE